VGAVTSAFRIAGATDSWGDRNDALAQHVEGGPVDAVLLDYLAEITMSILRRRLARDARAGYARDFLVALELPRRCCAGSTEAKKVMRRSVRAGCRASALVAALCIAAVRKILSVA
jgi:Acyclic terpene utilisation family protein AtuA